MNSSYRNDLKDRYYQNLLYILENIGCKKTMIETLAFLKMTKEEYDDINVATCERIEEIVNHMDKIIHKFMEDDKNV